MYLKKRIRAVLLVALLTVMVIYGANRQMAARDAQVGFDIGSRDKETIYFWYTDESMTSFINGAAVDFGEREGARVIPVLTSEGEYLEAINRASLHSEQMPDVYLIGNDSLEKAFLAGLAGETMDEGTVCNLDNFPQAALTAVSYHGKNIAYPLYYETTALLYNQTYLDEWAAQQEGKGSLEEPLEEPLEIELDWVPPEDGIPASVDDILGIADSFDLPEGVDGVMKWDVSDILYNYWVVGAYMVMGGPAGDDENAIDINNPQTVECLEVYQALNQFFSMESDTITYDSVIQEFIDGKIMFTVATTDIVRRLEEAKEDGSFGYEYGVTTMPRVSGELDGAALSVTGAVAVNDYSEHRELANRFAAYLVDDCAEDLYGRTGKLAAKKNTNSDNGPAQIFKMEYADSVPMSKMMETGNFWLRLEVLFSKVWNGADVEPLLAELAEQIAAQTAGE